MSPAVRWTAILLFLTGLSLFAFKALVMEMPIVPSRVSHVWRVELQVSLRGAETPGSVTLRLPRTGRSQTILEEQFEAGRFEQRLREEDDARFVSWQGPVPETAAVSYTFRVHVRSGSLGAARATGSASPDDFAPAPAPIREQIERMQVAGDRDREATIGSLYRFVAHEVETAAGASDDDVLTLQSREGSRLGKARLLVSLLRATGIDARVSLGLDPTRPSSERAVHFVEVLGDDGWRAVDPSAPDERFPSRLVVLVRGDRPLVTVSGVEAWSLRTRVLHESLGPEEIVSFMTPPSAFWRAISLYRVPIEAQANLQVLLVIPLAVLIAAIFRNLIGLRTFGTFMPVLIALSLREIDLPTGVALVTAVLGTGILGRLFLDRLRLLFVPRVSLLLCLVVLSVAALALLGHATGGQDLLTGLLLPIVILAMLIERIAVTGMEEGSAAAARLLANSLLVAAAAYPVFHSELLSHLFFGFPEITLCVMAALVAIGGYTGYRVAELFRFRALADRIGSAR